MSFEVAAIGQNDYSCSLRLIIFHSQPVDF